MHLISTKGYENAYVYCLRIMESDKIWVSMKNVTVGLGVMNISDLVLKEICGIYVKRKLTKEETKRYKMTERYIFKKYYNLSEDELNTKSNKNVFVKNIVMKNIIKHCRGEKKRNKSNRRI